MWMKHATLAAAVADAAFNTTAKRSRGAVEHHAALSALHLCFWFLLLDLDAEREEEAGGTIVAAGDFASRSAEDVRVLLPEAAGDELDLVHL
jgi:hypothetical protein